MISFSIDLIVIAGLSEAGITVENMFQVFYSLGLSAHPIRKQTERTICVKPEIDTIYNHYIVAMCML